MSSGAPRIGLVLGAGGIAGYSFHAGSLVALERATGWDARTAEVVVGTSAGSSVGAVLRGNVSVTNLVERILSVPTDFRGMDRLRRVAGRGQSRLGLNLLFPASPGLIVGEMSRLHRARLGRLIAASLPAGSLDTTVLGEQADVLHPDGWPDRQLWIPAVDLDSGRITVFGRDDCDVAVGTAVAASCAIPAYFKPVEANGRRYVDGGVRSMTNADLLADTDLDLVVALSAMSLDRPSTATPVGSLLRSLPSLQLKQELDRLERAGIPTIVLEPDATVSRAVGPNPMDPTRVVSVLTASAIAATERIETSVDPDLLKLLRIAGERLISPPDVPYPD